MALSQEILKRTTESYRRLRNTLRFLLANLSDFDPVDHAVPFERMLELDQYAVLMAKTLQDKVAGEHYVRYAFHHAMQEIVVYCAEDLGAFYLDILKDRLYTTQADSAARRSAQTALYHITRSLLLLLSPVLCFTADEAWEVFTHNDEESTLYHTWHEFPLQDAAVESALTEKWAKIRAVRAEVNKEIEQLRVAEQLGSSLQAEVDIAADNSLFSLLASLGEDLKYVLIVSRVGVSQGNGLAIRVSASTFSKCERCWHYRVDVGEHAGHPALCGRCVGNIDGQGEVRQHA